MTGYASSIDHQIRPTFHNSRTLIYSQAMNVFCSRKKIKIHKSFISLTLIRMENIKMTRHIP